MLKGFWDGSSKINGRSCCGVVIKGVDRNKWITISKIAVPLGISTAMAAEVVGGGCQCLFGHPGSRPTQKSQRSKYQSVYRRHSKKSSNVIFGRKKSESSKILGKVCNIDPVLRKRASPRLDVEGIRHSDTRDPRLASSAIFPEHCSGRAPSPHSLLISALLLALTGRGDKTNPDKMCLGCLGIRGGSGWVVVVVFLPLIGVCGRTLGGIVALRLRTCQHLLTFAPTTSNWRTSVQNSSVDHGSMERKENPVRREDRKHVAICPVK